MNLWTKYGIHTILIVLILGDLAVSVFDKILTFAGGFFQNYLGFLWNPIPKENKLVKFICDHKDARSASEVYVVGEFNDWLHADKGKIHPTRWEAKRYALKKAKSGRRVIWKGDIRIPPGTHDFKFVANRNHWIGWYQQQIYKKGSKAPGGTNLKVTAR